MVSIMYFYYQELYAVTLKMMVINKGRKESRKHNTLM